MDNKEKQEILEQLLSNPNSMSYWLPKFEGKGFNIPETTIIPLTVEWLDWLFSDKYQREKIEEFSKWIIKKLEENNFDTNRELFMKTGNFSNKFVFNFPHLKNIDNIGEQYLSVFYGGMCVGCQECPEICVREFIHTNYERKSIYNGMKLNTEFRVFYDFDKQKIVGIFNYWDRETMQSNLIGDELKNFNLSIPDIESDFEYLQPVLKSTIDEKLKSVELTGIWSIDFMWDGQKFWLIDAAIGSQSYYYEKISSDTD